MNCYPRYSLILSLPACKVNMMKSLLLMGVNAAYGWGGRKGKAWAGGRPGRKHLPKRSSRERLLK